jgi:hypothetical protein
MHTIASRPHPRRANAGVRIQVVGLNLQGRTSCRYRFLWSPLRIDAAEQAGVNVTKNIGRALSQIEASNESLGNMLRLTIKTGLFCAYNPDPRFPIT